MRRIYLFVLLTAMVYHAAAQYNGFQSGQIYCKIRDTSSVLLDTAGGKLPALKDLYGKYGVTYCYHACEHISPTLDKFYLMKFDSVGQVDKMMLDMHLLPYIEYVEKVPKFYLFDLPNDYNPAEQYSLVKINAAQAWDITQGNKDVVVAIVDNAMNTRHEDL
jgi:serine protease